MAAISSILQQILTFALPPRCPICGVTVDDDNRFCLFCWQNLHFLGEPSCASCGRPFAFERPDGSVCVQCLTAPPVHDGVRAVAAYDDNSALLAMGLKYSARLGLADLMAEHLMRFAANMPPDSLIIPVPLHRWRLWSRGYNQSVLIGRALSRRTDLPMATDLLHRITATPPLRSMTAKERHRIVKNAFSLSKGAENQVSGRMILLVDDVYTSGSTTNACAKLLKKAGAGEVFVLCWARVLQDDEHMH